MLQTPSLNDGTFDRPILVSYKMPVDAKHLSQAAYGIFTLGFFRFGLRCLFGDTNSVYCVQYGVTRYVFLIIANIPIEVLTDCECV